MSRICNVCKIEKNISEFYSGRYKCKNCVNAAARKIRVDNPERYARYKKRHNEYLKERRYGITQEDFNKMLVDQNNSCAICKKEIGWEAAVDHCHTTNKIRGLLCRKCNLGLGAFKDNIETIRKAIAYVKDM